MQADRIYLHGRAGLPVSPGPLVVYLFNPFSESTFAKVLENLRSSAEQAPREIYVAYRYTEHEKLLAAAEWLEKIAGEEQWAVYRNRREIGVF